MSAAATSETTSTSGPGPLASPTTKGNTSTPALKPGNSTLSSCYVVNANGTESTNLTLSSPGIPKPDLSLTKASLPSAWSGQTNATNATTVWLNSTVFCVQLPATATPTATPSTRLTTTIGSSPGAGHPTLNISETKFSKTSTVSTTTSSHHTSPKLSGVLVTSSTRVVPVTPSSRLVSSSGLSATPECSSPTHAKSSSSSASSKTSSRSTIVKANPPSSPVSAPAHTTKRPSGATPTAPGVPKSPNTFSPARPAVPSSAPITVSNRPSPVWPSESSPTASGAPELPNTVFPPLPTVPSSAPVAVSNRPSPVLPSEPFPTISGIPELPNTITPVRPAVPSGASVTGSSKTPSPFPPASVTGLPTGFPTGLGTSGLSQSTRSTLTSTVTETPESTFSTPVSITETTDSHVTITAPPVITSTGLSTLSDGTVVTVTHVIANPPREAVSGSSNGDSFFRNHAAVVGVFLVSGFTLAGLVLLAFCCFRRRRRRAQRRGTRLPEISHPRPIQNPFADVTGNPAVRERAGPIIRWHGFMHPRGPASTTQSSLSLPHNPSEDNLPTAHSAPVPPPPVQRAPSRSSYRIPVPYAGIGANGNDTRAEKRQSTGAPNEPLQIQIAPPSSVPPRLPMRSPLRLLAAQNIAGIPRDNALNLSLSRASTPSVYPPSLPHLDADADSLCQEEVVANLPSSSLKREPSSWLTRGLSYGKSGRGHKLDGNTESQAAQISPVDADGTHSSTVSASSSSHAHYSPLESPASDTGTAFTSIQDGMAHNRKVSLPRVPPVALFTHQAENRKYGARLRRDS